MFHTVWIHSSLQLIAFQGCLDLQRLMFWIPGVLPAYCLVITHVFLYVALTKRDHKAYASFKLLPWEQSSLEENILIFFFFIQFFPLQKR